MWLLQRIGERLLGPGPVAEGLPPLAARVQAWGGDARRRPHSHRVVRSYSHRPSRWGPPGGYPVLAVFLAFRSVFGARVRPAPERERGLPEHPALHRHLPGGAGTERDCDSGRRPLPDGILCGSRWIRYHGVQPRSSLCTIDGSVLAYVQLVAVRLYPRV